MERNVFNINSPNFIPHLNRDVWRMIPIEKLLGLGNRKKITVRIK